MPDRKNIVLILIVFLVSTAMLLFIQFSSVSHIDHLISGNEQLLNEFRVSNELRILERDMFSVESKMRGAIGTGNGQMEDGLDAEISDAASKIERLRRSGDSTLIMADMDTLDRLVNEKMKWSRRVLRTFHERGRQEALQLLASGYGKRVSDSIGKVIRTMEANRKQHLRQTTWSIDESGRKARRVSTFLLVFVMVSGTGWLWYIFDTTRRQNRLIRELNASEKAVRESVQVKDRFLTNMSHEIRTPLNAILGFIYLLQRKPLDPESRSFVATMLSSCEKLLNIINDILDLSKIEAGMMRIESAPFSPCELFDSVEQMFRPRAVEKAVDLSVHLAPDVPAIICGDATRLTQILVNLIGNALKFTATGSVQVNVAAERTERSSVSLRIEVSDTGIGIEKDQLTTIFGRFQQAEDSVTRNYGGTGLGLTIVSDLVKLQHGSISVASVPGQGTTFTVMIPYLLVPDNGPIPSASGEQAAFVPLSGLRVLAADDNEINQNLLRHLLADWQVEATIVGNGLLALEHLRTQTYDVVLMDIQMPAMDGYSAVTAIRNELHSTVPVVAMTAHALAGEREKCLSFGMNDYISKPIRAGQLHGLLSRWRSPQLPGPMEVNSSSGDFRCIRLTYMKEISGGNRAYEKAVTGQFVESMPEELLELENFRKAGKDAEVRRMAHHLKTTISVMGLEPLLGPYLDRLEYETLDDDEFKVVWKQLTGVSREALREAKMLLLMFNG